MLQEMNTSKSVIVGGYTQQDWPVSEGTNATLSCPPGPGLTLSGPNITTCMGNGEWVPDLREVECKGEHMHLLLI